MDKAIKTFLTLVIISVLPSLGLSFLYSKGDDVTILTAANFEKTVVTSEGVSMVEFYAPCKVFCCSQ